jgi:hypothetical protein
MPADSFVPPSAFFFGGLESLEENNRMMRYIE